jgi:hypothetical protein
VIVWPDDEAALNRDELIDANRLFLPQIDRSTGYLP